MATLIILNLLIVRAIRKSYSFRALLAQRGAGQAQVSLTLMCCGVVALFLVCQTPGLIVSGKNTYDSTVRAAGRSIRGKNVTMVTTENYGESKGQSNCVNKYIRPRLEKKLRIK